MAKSEPPKEYRFKPGQSGNPKGKEKGTKSLTTILRKALEQKDGEFTKQEKIIAKMLDMAENGNMRSIQEIFDRIEGKPRQEIDHSGSIPVETEVVVNVVRDEKKKPKN